MNTKTNDRLGIVLSTVTDAPVQELVEIGQLAEAHGYDSVFVNEGRGDSLACAQAIAMATSTIKVGTNIANIYFRHPFLAASTARTIAELSSGRLILGLGMSHRSLLKSLGIDMGDARDHLQRYLTTVKECLSGGGAAGFLQPPESKFPVPIYAAGNTEESAKIAGVHSDGLMPFLSPLSYIPRLMAAAKTARAEAGLENTLFGCILSMPVFVSDDEEAARSAARYNLAFFSKLPNYRRQWRRAGYADTMDRLKALWLEGNRREAAAEIPDALIDEVCVVGTPARCREQLDAFRRAGVDVPVLAVSPVNEDRLVATRRAIEALAPT